MKQELVYVQAPDGTPLMPTRRFGKVRRLLKSKQAEVVYRKPFTIRLTGEPSGRYVQNVTIGIDPGRTNIGVAAIDDKGNCLFRGKLETRNKEIKNLMKHRKAHRQASRRGERLRRRRRARQNGTTKEFPDGRMLPGYEKPVMLKDITNTEAKFNNRRHPKGWLTPSARQLKQSHFSVINLIQKLLPIHGVAMEINRFAFMELEAGHRLWGEQFQHGLLFGYKDMKSAVDDMQDRKCLLCRKAAIEHYHHLVPRSRNGSDTVRNMVGLCKNCHTKVHTDKNAKERLLKKQKGIFKKFCGVSLLNTIIPSMAEEIIHAFGDRLYPVSGLQTSDYRKEFKLEKDHDIDAYVIACIGTGFKRKDYMETCIQMKQFRNHDRARINSQRERTYKTGKTVVAKNRKPRFEQKGDSLKDWYEKRVSEVGKRQADKERSQLTVTKSTRYYNNMNRILPGAVFASGQDGLTHILSAQLTGGEYYRALDTENINHSVKQCSIRRTGGGIVFI